MESGVSTGGSNIVNTCHHPVSEILSVAEVVPSVASVDSDSDAESATVRRGSQGHESTTSNDFVE